MRITKYTHSCVRIEHADGILVIDPGIWSEPEALVGADAVLVTHEHIDHVDVARLMEFRAPVYAPEGAEIVGLHFTGIASGEVFNPAGFEVRAVGRKHAVTYGDRSNCANLGYIIDDACYHPGDALHVPDVSVDTLLVPIQGAWLKTSEAIDFVRAVGPRCSVAIHDAQVNDRGLESLNGWLARETGVAYRFLRPGETA